MATTEDAIVEEDGSSEEGEDESGHGSVTSAHSAFGSEGSFDGKPVKADKDLTIYEILERRATSQTVIDILKDEEDFKVYWRSMK